MSFIDDNHIDEIDPYGDGEYDPHEDGPVPPYRKFPPVKRTKKQTSAKPAEGNINHTSVKLTRAVNDLFAFTADCYRDEFGDDNSHKREFCRRIAERYAELIGCNVVDVAKLKSDVESTHRGTGSLPKIATANTLATKATALAEQIIELADSPDLPSAGIDYAESVADKARDILESVESENRATSGQIEALQNMLDGLERWFHD